MAEPKLAISGLISTKPSQGGTAGGRFDLTEPGEWPLLEAPTGTPELLIATNRPLEPRFGLEDVAAASPLLCAVPEPAWPPDARAAGHRLFFVVPCAPAAMARPRVAVRGGKAHAYTPTKAA
ncbi:MAG: hypothetical protein ACREN7_02815 [Candidatus Dormibacteria bacterium]